MKRLVACSIFVLLASVLCRDAAALPLSDTVDLVGEVRIREEFNNHVFSPSDPEGALSYDFAHMRSRLGIAATLDKHTWLGIKLQDVRVLGGEGSTVTMLNSVDLKQGEIRLTDLLGTGDQYTLGRFDISLGDQRLVGALDWVDQGRSFDGLRAAYRPKKVGGELIATRIRETGAEHEDQTLLGLVGDWTNCGWKGELTALHLIDDKLAPAGNPDNTTAFTTLSLRVAGTGASWDATGEAAVQDGRLGGQSLEAFAFAVKGGVTLNPGGTPLRLGAEVDGATGNKSLGDDVTETFQTLFPTNHMHYGMMDLMAWSNMTAISLNAKISPSSAVSVTASGFLFSLWTSEGGWRNAAGTVIRPGVAGASKDLGSEFDLLFNWKASTHVSVQAGWSVFLPGSFVEETGPSPTPMFSYLQVRAAL